jgi:hypothetical protein
VIGPLNTFFCALTSVATFGTTSPPQHLVLLYIVPEQILPLTSYLGALAGILLIFWSKVVNLFVRIKKLTLRK